MRINNFRKMAFEDFPKAPEWFENVPNTLNPTLSQLTQALQGNITFQDNILSEDFTGAFKHGVQTQVQLRYLKTRPQFVLPGYNSVAVTGCSITQYTSNTQVGVTIYFNGAPTAPQTLTLRFLP